MAGWDDPILAGLARRLDERRPSLEMMQHHGVHLLAADWWRTSGQRIEPQMQRALDDELVRAHARHLLREAELARILEVTGQPTIVLKGDEIATHYPDPALRPAADIDILVLDPEAAQRRLIDAGWIETGFHAAGRAGQVRHHHLVGLSRPGSPIGLEVHRRPSWLNWMRPPAPDQLFECAEESEISSAPVLRPDVHVLVVASHLLRSDPFARLRDLVDVGLLRSQASVAAVAQLAADWNGRRAWEIVNRTVDSLLLDSGRLPVTSLALGRPSRRMELRREAAKRPSTFVMPFFAYGPIDGSRFWASRVKS